MAAREVQLPEEASAETIKAIVQANKPLFRIALERLAHLPVAGFRLGERVGGAAGNWISK